MGDGKYVVRTVASVFVHRFLTYTEYTDRSWGCTNTNKVSGHTPGSISVSGRRIYMAVGGNGAGEYDNALRIGRHHPSPTAAQHLERRPDEVWGPICDDDFRITRSLSKEPIVVRASGRIVCAQCDSMRAMRFPIAKLGLAALCAQHEIALCRGRSLGGLSEMRRITATSPAPHF